MKLLLLLFDVMSFSNDYVNYSIAWLPLSIAAGALVGGATSFFGQRSANRTNIDLANQANQFEVDMWNKNNLYNNPVEQMKRLKEAGLNPNLIYGSGSSAVGISNSIPKPHVAQVSNELQSLSTVIPSIIGAYQDYKLKEAQIDNVKSNTAINNKKKNLLDIDQSLKEIKLLNDKDYRNFYWDDRWGNNGLSMDIAYKTAQTNMLEQNFRRSTYALDNLDPQLANLRALEYDSKNLEYETNQGLRPYNLNMGDSLFAKLIVKLLEQLK